jgi:hypothetical protein
MNIRHFVTIASLGGLGLILYFHQRPVAASGAVAHVENGFEFTVKAPYDTVAPLFGALKEKVWAGDEWNPVFVYPDPAHDIEGAVFKINHGHGHAEATWINTVFDLESGHVQYVYVVPEKQAVLIDIHLVRHEAPSSTEAKVVYKRTALRPEFNERVAELGNKDRHSGPEWSSGIDAYLGIKPLDAH